jgi:hypothetical protein
MIAPISSAAKPKPAPTTVLNRASFEPVAGGASSSYCFGAL